MEDKTVEEVKQSKHNCGLCGEGFPDDEGYLRHLCSVTDSRPGGEIEEEEPPQDTDKAQSEPEQNEEKEEIITADDPDMVVL